MHCCPYWLFALVLLLQSVLLRGQFGLCKAMWPLRVELSTAETTSGCPCAENLGITMMLKLFADN